MVHLLLYISVTYLLFELLEHFATKNTTLYKTL